MQDDTAGGQRWEPVKLLRAEWAHPRSVPALYSRVLYITNLPLVGAPIGILAFASSIALLQGLATGSLLAVHLQQFDRGTSGHILVTQALAH